MYKLSRVIQAHKRDARSIDYFDGILVTGGSDKTCRIYSYKAGAYTEVKSAPFDSEVISTKINKRNPQSPIFVVIGLRNGQMHALDRNGDTLFSAKHEATISSLDFVGDDAFVCGSWDGKATVWSIDNQEKVCEYSEGKHAVCVFYNKINNYITSGSQDKSLNIWDRNTAMKFKRVENAHNDIVREIVDIEASGMIATCSNDETVKIWSGDLEPIQTLLGHTAFVFSVKALKMGLYASGGEDKVLKIWEGQSCVQDLQLPGSIWSITFDENNDLFTADSDGIVRSFTTDPSRRAEADVEEMFNKQVLEASSKKSGMTEDEIKKLMTTAQMNTLNGKKEGEIRVFRNGMVPEAYSWQGGKWTKIGDVITEGGGAGGAPKPEPRYYPGDPYFEAGLYDYIFDVDDDSGAPKVIPFNDGGNPMDAAERYCRRQNMTKGYIEQIRKFLVQNASKSSRSEQKMSEETKDISTGLMKCTPAYSAIEYTNVKNPQALFNKLKEFNEKAEDKKLNEREIAYIENVVTQLENEKTYHSWKLDFKEMDTLKKTLSWPKDLKFPVWDMLRAFLKHYQSQALFSGLEAGGDIITQLAVGLETEYPEPIYALILKTLSNILIQNTNKGGMLRHADIAFSSMLNISKRSLNNPSFLASMASFLYNFSIACVEKTLQKEEVLDSFAQLLEKRLSLDENFENRTLLLQSGANVLFKHHSTKKAQLQFLLKYLQADDVSTDIKLFY